MATLYLFGFRVYMQYIFSRYTNFVCSIYLLRKFDMFFVSLKTRYDINLVAKGNISSATAHIESIGYIENLIRDLYR